MERARTVLVSVTALVVLGCASGGTDHTPADPAWTGSPEPMGTYEVNDHGWIAEQPSAPGASRTPVSSAPATPPSSPPARNVYYRSCAEARAAGAAPLRRGEPGYRPGLDRDGDGTACDS